jgi:hypothetical protein
MSVNAADEQSKAADGYLRANDRNGEFGSPEDRFRAAIPNACFWL